MLDQLLTLLSENARLSCAQLAAMLNKTEAQVQEEIAAPKKAGIIRGYQKHGSIGEKVGPNRASALIELKVSPKAGQRALTTLPTRIMQLEEVRKRLPHVRRLLTWLFALTAEAYQEIAMFVARKLSPYGFGLIHGYPFYPEALQGRRAGDGIRR